MAADWWKQEPEIDWPSDKGSSQVIPGRPEPDLESIEIAELVTRQVFNEAKKEIQEALEKSGGQGGSGGNHIGTRGDSPFDDDGDNDRKTDGTDACAFYLSFRYPNRRWGIYIQKNCWCRLAKYFHSNGIRMEIAIDEAFLLLYRHEYFHFEVDKASAVLECAIAHSTGQFLDLWLEYHARNNPSRLEEALANAHSFEHSGKKYKKYRSEITGLVGDWMNKQPAGYRDFRDVIGKYKGEARSQLLSEITGVKRNNKSYVSDLQPLIRPKSFVSESDDTLKQRYKGKSLNLYFF